MYPLRELSVCETVGTKSKCLNLKINVVKVLSEVIVLMISIEVLFHLCCKTLSAAVVQESVLKKKKTSSYMPLISFQKSDFTPDQLLFVR